MRELLLYALVLTAVHQTSAQFPGHILNYTINCTGHDEFVCRDDSCIRSELYCDGENHCPDGSDEEMCDGAKEATQRECNATAEFPCADSGYCIPLNWRCNGEPDCMDKSDEFNCTTAANETCTGFLCKNGECIPDIWECDTTPDCLDKSDEANCANRSRYDKLPPANITIICNRDNGYFPCDDESFCLDTERVCNNVKDCKDGSDEGPGCNGTCKDVECSHGCFLIPTGPYCKCPYGYTHTSNTTCRDINECEEQPEACSQHCHNKIGYHTCSCVDGYELARDRFNCNAKGGEAILFYSLRDQIRAFNIKTRKTTVITSHTEQAVGVTYDGFHIYWTEFTEGHEAIMRAELEDPKGTKEVVVQTGLEGPEDVTIDWLTGSIYFTDNKLAHIGVCSAEGRHCTVLVSENIHRPRAIALHPQWGQMYWTDWGDSPEIVRANMDGSEPITFLKDRIKWPNGLFLDFANERLYWVDGHAGGIESIKLDGTLRHEVLQNEVHHPYWVSVFEDKLFWSDWGSKTLQVCEKFTGKERHVLARGNVYGVHVWHKAMTPHQPHMCEHNLCSDLCLLRGNTSYTCACPEDKFLAQDNHTCHNAVQPQYLIVTGGTLMVRLRYRQLGRLELSPVMLQIGSVDAQAYNRLDDIVYMYDGMRNSIAYVKMNQYKEGITGVLVHDNLDRVEDMAHDYVSNVLYWVDSGRKTIEVFSMKTKYRTILYKFGGTEVPISICVIPEYGLLLVALRDGYDEVHIDSMGLDGKHRKHVFENGFKGPTMRIRYYPDEDKIYISDSGNSIIESAHPEGSGRESFRELFTSISSLALAGSQVFWTNKKTSNLHWTNMHDTGKGPNRRLNLDIFTNHTQLHLSPIISRPPVNDPIWTHPCVKNDPCSHICVQSEHRNKMSTGTEFLQEFLREYTCLCPSGMFATHNSCQDRVKCASDLLYCHKSNECVARAKKCDGLLDCKLGEDEEGCIDPTTHQCHTGQFQCGSGECIPENHHCDLHIDCLDSSDEAKCEGHGMALLCKEDQFECDGGTCLDTRLVCDGAPDCPDGSDENKNRCDTLQCTENQFQCKTGNCIPKHWECDHDVDCNDGSDEHDKCAHNRPGGPSCGLQCRDASETSEAQCVEAYQFRCENGHCIMLKDVCNKVDDCGDNTDEEECDTEDTAKDDDTNFACIDKEYLCPTNRSICLPYSARCNTTRECPRGEDEIDCVEEEHCTGSEYHCGDGRCVSGNLLCDGVADCRDGSDETPSACNAKNTSRHLPVSIECEWGYQCDSGHCLDYGEVCDGKPNCADKSDELGVCDTACEHHHCAHICSPTPRGAVCRCFPGYHLAPDFKSCMEHNECNDPEPPCSHECQNTEGSFVCTCHYGYTLRSDRRSCKARGEPLSILTLADDTIRSVTRLNNQRKVVFKDPRFRNISDFAVNVGSNSLYFTSESLGLIYRTDFNGKYHMPVHNVGKPTKVAVDWITDNVYFVDNTTLDKWIRVCSLWKQRCARLQKLYDDNEVTALTIDPANRFMFYCATGPGPVPRSSLYKADLDGRHITPLVQDDLSMCSGLAVDTYRKVVYVSQNHADSIVSISYDGNKRSTMKFVDHRVVRPGGLALFEDHIYYATTNSHRMTRCYLYGVMSCEEFNVHTSDARAFVLKQQSAQRRDAPDTCKGFSCEGVCAPAPLGAKCVCADGTVLHKGETCAVLPEEMMAVFDVPPGMAPNRGVRITYIILSLLIFLIMLSVVLLYLYRYWQRMRATGYGPTVHFHNPSFNQEVNPRPEPTVNVAAPTTASGFYEFVNPIRGAWRSMQSRMATQDKLGSAIHLNLPNNGDSDSDVESDRDDIMREKARLL